jgi:superfamily II DNA or RNA helicase
MELGGHAEFLGICSHAEMLSTYFVHDGGETSQWRLKGHAEQDFWKWLCSWAIVMKKPSDLGYDDNGFILPPITYHEHIVRADKKLDGYLFAMPASTLQERLVARRDTIEERVAKCAEIVNGTDQQFLVWCHLNAESEALAKAIPRATEISGSDSREKKEQAIADFQSGKIPVLISKSTIFGFGLNLQNAWNAAFVGLNDSFESLYQTVRRIYRFGQRKPVKIHLIASDIEGAVLSNIKRKEADAENMSREMLAHMVDLNAEALKGESMRLKDAYEPKVKMTLPEWL